MKKRVLKSFFLFRVCKRVFLTRVEPFFSFLENREKGWVLFLRTLSTPFYCNKKNFFLIKNILLKKPYKLENHFFFTGHSLFKKPRSGLYAREKLHPSSFLKRRARFGPKKRRVCTLLLIREKPKKRKRPF